MNKKRSLILFIAICLVLVFSGCDKEQDEYDYNIMYLDKTGIHLVSEGYNTETKDVNALIEELIGLMKNPVDKKEEMTPGFDVCDIIGYSVNSDGYLRLTFDAGYSTLTHFKEIVCRAAIVKTLSQIEGINGVEFYINEMPYLNENGEPYGYMSEETFVDNTSGETTYKQKISANVYFASAKGNKLVQVPINVTFDGTISLEQLVLEQLIKGPSAITGADETLLASVPENTVINQITVREQICYVDICKDFLTQVEGVKREVTLYSVVNTLADLSNINKVQFTIDGQKVEFFGNTAIVFDAPLERNLELVQN